ncbi:MAG: Ig-like domain repeat protein, partial [Candidatus Sulfotelmatobacter sp.]
VEADLDLETVSGVARNATIYYVFGKNADDAAAYVIDNHTLIPVSVISESFGLCEPTAGTTYLTQQETIAEQGNSEGITWAASSGDTGAAACEPNGGSSSATTGLAVNEPASLPGVIGVGGTEFSADVTDQSQYWNTANTAIDESAISYIPEMAWNDSVGTGDGPLLNSTLSASGGGASTAFTKPSWQVGVGVPKDNARDVPDVSMTASANHDGYVIFCSNSGAGCTAATPEIVGGTSAATPLFSSILILLNHYLVKNGLQKTPGLTNVNQTLYQLAANSSSPFHDITTGSNIVPCTNPSPNCPTSGKFQFGFSAGVGYDQVTGLGSVDAYNFVIAWANSVKTPTTTAVAISTATVTVGSSVTLTATITPAPPDGETVTFTDTKSNATLGTASTASGKATFTSTTIAGGSYTVVASYPGDTTLASSASTSAQALNIQDFSLSPSTLSIAVSAPGQNGSGTITFGLLGGLSQAPSFSCSGLPSESTCTFTAASATSETVTIGTTPASWLHDGPLGRRSGIFYALLFPGLVGLVLPSGRRKRTLRVVLGLLAVFTVVTLWMPACGGSSGGGNHNPGTPVGQTSATVTASESGISHTVTINLNVQ